MLETYLEELYVIRSSGGLHAAEQFQKQAKGALSGELREGQLPSRGAIEVKSTGEEVKNIARSEQVMRYVNRYKQVLVTNVRFNFRYAPLSLR